MSLMNSRLTIIGLRTWLRLVRLLSIELLKMANRDFYLNILKHLKR